MVKKMTVKEIAMHFKVTVASVYYWLKNGLPHETEHYQGFKQRIVINPDDVIKFHDKDRK